MGKKKPTLPHMKHILKKTVDYSKLDAEFIKSLPGDERPSYSEIPKDTLLKNDILQFMEDGTVIRTFTIPHKKDILIVPVVNPVLVYFHQAQSQLAYLLKQKETILATFVTKKIDNSEGRMGVFYNFFASSSTFIVMLYTSLEAFINQKIPVDKTFQEKNENKYMKLYTAEQAQRYMTFNNKIRLIIEAEYGKSFTNTHQSDSEHLNYLTDYRHEIVHTRKVSNWDNYQNIYKKALEFDYLKALYAVRRFVNFYDSNLIEDCNCNEDF